MSRKVFAAIAGLTCALVFLAGTAVRAEPAAATGHSPPSPGDFLNHALSQPRLSPSGRYLAYDMTENGVDELVVTDLDGGTSSILFKTKPATKDLADKDARQEIASIRWKGDERLIISLIIPETSMRNDELVAFPVVNLITARDGSKTIQLGEKGSGSRALASLGAVLDSLKTDPDHILAALRASDGGLSVFKVDVRDGSKVEIEHGGPRVSGYGVDKRGNIVTRTVVVGHDSVVTSIYVAFEYRAPGDSNWTKLMEVHRKELRALGDVEPIEALDTPGQLLVFARQDAGQGDTRAVRLFDAKTKTLGAVLFANGKYDVDNVLMDDSANGYMAACYWADVQVCAFTDKALQAQYEAFARAFKGERTFEVFSRAEDDSRWVIHASGPNDAGTFYIFNRKTRALDELGQVAPILDAAKLGRTQRFDYKARDGVQLSGYLTLPPQTAAMAPPLVVLPHGGPEDRDHLGYDVWVQYLASRGYAVLQPNFRGSGGFGRTFAEAGYGEWGGRMSDDLDDAVKAALATGKVDARRVCIVGGSYGGYAALYEAGTKPDLYKCAVSIDGLADLNEDMGWEKREHGADSDTYHYWLKSLGDPSKDGSRLADKSPIRMARGWKVPTLLIHGDADDIVFVEQSRSMNRALKGAGVNVRYVEIKDMGHGPGTLKEWTQVLNEIDGFLGEYIKP
jgi:dipeptidyl aminopeptidase/acylaminoacyl peptidase